jgi:hypothetical protein
LTDKDLWGKPAVMTGFVIGIILFVIGMTYPPDDHNRYVIGMLISGAGVMIPILVCGWLYPEQSARMLGKQKVNPVK